MPSDKGRDAHRLMLSLDVVTKASARAGVVGTRTEDTPRHMPPASPTDLPRPEGQPASRGTSMEYSSSSSAIPNPQVSRCQNRRCPEGRFSHHGLLESIAVPVALFESRGRCRTPPHVNGPGRGSLTDAPCASRGRHGEDQGNRANEGLSFTEENERNLFD
jgi:hypothetical protein